MVVALVSLIVVGYSLAHGIEVPSDAWPEVYNSATIVFLLAAAGLAMAAIGSIEVGRHLIGRFSGSPPARHDDSSGSPA